MNAPPEVDFVDGSITGWDEFEQWANANMPQWHCALQHVRGGRMSKEDALRMLAYLFTIDHLTISNRLADITLIAPKKMQFSDGIRVYRCPDELIPLEKPSFTGFAR